MTVEKILIVKYKNRMAADEALKILLQQNISLVMSAEPRVSDDGRISFISINYPEDKIALKDMIRDTNGVEKIEEF